MKRSRLVNISEVAGKEECSTRGDGKCKDSEDGMM